ncbi:ArsR family transcriptional regulator, partial [Escherichia coli]|nr:ArsR family transcriptional regulator [Escherichia coli]
MSVANTSRHLQELRSARLVEVRREGPYGHYRLADERVFGLWRAIRELGEARLAEIDRLVRAYLKYRESLE